MTARRRAPAVLLLLVATAAPAAAQTDLTRLYDRPVASVRLEVEGRTETSAALLGVLDVRPGEPLRPEAIRSSMRRLFAIGRFEDITVVGTDGPGGVDVVFRLAPRHPIDAFVVRGNTGLPAAELTGRLRREYGGVPATVRPDTVAATLRTMLADEGYLGAAVEATTEETHGPDRATLVLTVEAGPRSRIARTEILGRSLLSADLVRQRTGTVPGSPYRRRAIDTGLVSIRDELRARRYYEAVATHRLSEPAEDGSIVVTFFIEAGPRVVLVWAGDPRPPGREEDLVPLAREGSADEDLLDDAAAAMTGALRRDGYWRAAVDYTREIDEAGGELVITFTVTRGLRYLIERVRLEGTGALPRAAVDPLLGLQAGEPFSEDRVRRARDRVVGEYLRRGFHKVAVDWRGDEIAGAATRTEHRVVVTITIAEGPQAVVADVIVEGATEVPVAQLRGVMHSRPGEPYVRALVALDQLDLVALYASLGFQSATVRVEPEFDTGERRVTLRVTVAEGPRITVASIQVVGNARVSRDAILAELALREGEPLSENARIESLRRLFGMGAFSSVSITPEPRWSGETNVVVIVSVVEAPATTVGFGGGVEAATRARSAVGGGVEDHLEFSPRGFVEFGRRNLGGKNRFLNAFARVSLKPRDVPEDPLRDGRGFGFSEYRVTATLRERRAFRSDTDLLFGATSEQAVRTSFNFIRQALNAEILHRLTPDVAVSGRYALDFTELFNERIPPDEQLLIDRLFPQVRLSLLSAGVFWDRRDDPVDPARGTLVGFDFEVAVPALGSEVGYAKAFVQGSAFRPLAARLTLAGRAQVGLARGFENPDDEVRAGGEPNLPASQRFFAGGGSSVRGFDIDRLGVPSIINADGLSNGGNALVVLNLELRTRVGRLFSREFGAVGFIDSGNVFARTADLDLAGLRWTAGFGFRYDSPIGPLRLDFGFKLDRRTVGARRERGGAWHLNIGHAF